jgi:hypothetical protein
MTGRGGLVPPIAHLEAITRADANRLLDRWGHKMGGFTRPTFAIEAHHALFQNGEPIALASTSEPAREVVGQSGVRRDQVVELARLCAARRDLNRAMLRLWRELILPAYLSAHRRSWAVSYQDEAHHTGDIYRFDGWIDIGRGGGGGTDARSGRKGRKMRIWGYPRSIVTAIAQPEERAA